MVDKDNFINKIKKRRGSFQKDEMLFKIIKGKSVLDVGCIGQDKTMESGDWLHDKIRNVASICHGVDIESEEVTKMQHKGYEIFLPGQIELKSMKYDVVVMADVIEHVNDPVEFIRYYGHFLNDEGIIVLTTPNSNAIRNFVQIIINNSYSVNPQHTFWFCPLTLLEVTERAGYKPVDFFWLKEYHTVSALKRRIDRFKYRACSIMYKFRSNFSPNFLLTIKKA